MNPEPRHIWIMKPNGSEIPRCMFCNTDTIRAQMDQPGTQGAGPCPELRKRDRTTYRRTT